MSNRRIDVSGVQILASVLAAVSGAVLASYLGVAGTIIGTAVMSVAGTAGTAVYKHYLGRTAGRLRETPPVAAAHRAAEWMTAGTHTAIMQGQAAETARDTQAPHDRAAARAADAARDTPPPAATGPGDGPAGSPAGRLARWWAAVRGWPRWAKLAAVSAVIFIGVIGAVTVVEVAAGKPLQTVVWNHKASGTTVGNLVGGPSSPTTRPARPHARPSGSAPSSSAPSGSRTGSASPSPSPSSSSPSPSPSPTTGTSSPPASSSPSPDPTGTRTAPGTAKASAG